MRNNSSKKITSSLWLRFVLTIFIILMLIIAAFCIAIYLMFNVGAFDRLNISLFMPAIAILIFSLLLGSSLSLFVGYRVLKPIGDFCKASNEIIDGNFNVRLNEKSPIYDIKMMATTFNTMANELSGIETFRNDFVNNVSHEFKTPLSAIEGYATLLQNPNLSLSEKNQYTSYIISSSKQLSKLTNNILNLTKLENQEIVTDNELYRIDEELRKAILVLEPEWTKKNISFLIDLPKQLHYGNLILMRQIWTNLIGNAIKYSNNYSEINISLTSNDTNIFPTLLLSSVRVQLLPSNVVPFNNDS